MNGNAATPADAQHILMGEVPARRDEIDRSATLYVICKAGGRSAKVAEFLAHEEFSPVTVARLGCSQCEGDGAALSRWLDPDHLVSGS